MTWDGTSPQACGGCGAQDVTLVFMPGGGWEGLPSGVGLCLACGTSRDRSAELVRREQEAEWRLRGDHGEVVILVSDSDYATAGDESSGSA